MSVPDGRCRLTVDSIVGWLGASGGPPGLWNLPAESGVVQNMPELTVTLWSSSFCGACTSTRQTLDAIAPLLGERVAWREINVADAPDEAERLEIAATPTVLVTDASGAERFRAAGVPTTAQVLTALAAALP